MERRGGNAARTDRLPIPLVVHLCRRGGSIGPRGRHARHARNRRIPVCLIAPIPAADALADIGPDALAAIRQAAASDSPAVRRAATRAMELTIAESELVKATRVHVPCGDSYLTRLMPRDATNVQVQAARLSDPDVT